MSVNNSDKVQNTMKDKHKAALAAAFLLSAGIVYLLLGLFLGFYIPCPFRMVTGLKCPGCGLSHAATDLARLDFAGAMSHNALFIPIFIYIAYYFYRSFLRKNKDPLADKTGRRIDMIFLIVILLWWVFRNIFGL